MLINPNNHNFLKEIIDMLNTEEKKDHGLELIINFDQQKNYEARLAQAHYMVNLETSIVNNAQIINLTKANETKLNSVKERNDTIRSERNNYTLNRLYNIIKTYKDILSEIENNNVEITEIENNNSRIKLNIIKDNYNIITLIENSNTAISLIKNNNHKLTLIKKSRKPNDAEKISLINSNDSLLSLIKDNNIAIKQTLINDSRARMDLIKITENRLSSVRKNYKKMKKEKVADETKGKLNLFLTIFLMKVLTETGKIRQLLGLVVKKPQLEKELKEALNNCSMLLIKLADENSIEKDKAIKIEKDLLTLYKAILGKFKKSLGENRPNVSVLNTVANTLITILDKKYNQSPPPNEIVEIMRFLFIKDLRPRINDDNDYVKNIAKILKILLEYYPCIVVLMLDCLYKIIEIDTLARKKLSAIIYLASKNIVESTKFVFDDETDTQQLKTYRAEADNSKLKSISAAPTTEIQVIRLMYDILVKSFATGQPINNFLRLELIIQNFVLFPVMQVAQMDAVIVNITQRLSWNRLNIKSDNSSQYSHRPSMIYYFWNEVTREFNTQCAKKPLLPIGSYFSNVDNLNNNYFYSRNIDTEYDMREQNPMLDDMFYSIINIKIKTIDYFLDHSNIVPFDGFITSPEILQQIHADPYNIDAIATTIAGYNIVYDELNQGQTKLTELPSLISNRSKLDPYKSYYKYLIKAIKKIATIKYTLFGQFVAELNDLQQLKSTTGSTPFELSDLEMDCLITAYLREIKGCYPPNLVKYQVHLFYQHRPTNDDTKTASADESYKLKNT